MKILFEHVQLLEYEKPAFVAVDGEYIVYVGTEKPDSTFDRIINGNGRLLVSGLYNAHCHSAMTLFRGYGEDLPLDRWLNERILPAEGKLTNESVYLGSMLAIAEMLRRGIVSFTDMYFFCDQTVRAVDESGIKANISRSVVTFDPAADLTADKRIKEAAELFRSYNGTSSGRVKIDFAIHAEYSNTEEGVRYVSALARENNARMQIHMSETEKEQRECMQRRGGKTPAEFFEECGTFDVPTNAAHCVWVTDNDISILKKHGVTASHNPVSNLKLGSGVMPLRRLLDAGVNVALGTDGAASNNSLDMLYELRVASILHKGISRRADETRASEMWALASKNGALSQGRDDCGAVKAGNRADMILIDTDSIGNIPMYNKYAALCYSASSSDVVLTMADGRILYENGEYKTIDTEKLRHDFSAMLAHYFG